MEKTLQTQYNLIKEGKGDKAYFLKSAYRLFPDMLSPVNTFEDTTRILKNRGIISENIGGLVTTGKKQDWHVIFNENIAKLKENAGDFTVEKPNGQILKYFPSRDEALAYIDQVDPNKMTNLSTKQIKNVEQNGDKSYTITYEDDTTKTIWTSNDAWDYLNDKYHNNPLRESKEVKAIEKETTKEVTDMATRGYDYKDEKNYDNLFGEEFLKGYYTEMKDPKNADKDVEELRAIVAKNLAKDISYYVKNGQFGVKGLGYTTEAPGLGEPQEPKGKHASSGYGDIPKYTELKESVLRLAIQDIIKEVLSESLDKNSIKEEGERAKKEAMKKRITNEIVKRKKQRKALETLTELEDGEDNDNAKKIKELQSEIKQLEGMAAKLDGKKKVKEAGTYAGAKAVDDMKKDPDFNTLNTQAKIDAEKKLRTGGSMTVGENKKK